MRLTKSGLASRRVGPRVTGTTVAVVAALTVAACSSSGTAAQKSFSSTGAGQGANTAAAKSAIAPFTGHPSAFPVDTPLSKKLPAGTSFVYFQCGAATCALTGNYLKQAVTAIGGSLTVINSGSTASSSQAAASSALSLKPDVAIVNGIDPSFFGDGLKSCRLQASR